MYTPRIKRIAHIVLYVRDPEASARWYKDVLGMEISSRVGGGPYKGGVFMTFGHYDHDIALFPGDPEASRGKEIEHVALELDCGRDLNELRRVYASFLDKGVKIAEVLDHGVAHGLYFYDPDGHMLEIFAPTVEPSAATIEEFRAGEGKADPVELTPLRN
ncbi:glyoxalase [Sphingomonas sp. CL5.1]|uniref:VOC family protein n=1 Tax=Sphingomonas sp. CL5.1 TaxID=2653203 RepID=UPI00158314B3|nr:VOC family protein [Sphingomonas sp. CL5.1]QKR99595.1 glyoxalase [Sphingomonas sp. CL5.1]